MEWTAVGGNGRIYSYVVFHRSFHPSFPVPYNVCTVELDEGPRLISQVLDILPESLRVGLQVTADFSGRAGEVPIIQFRCTSDAAAAAPQVQRFETNSHRKDF
ncbi:hypothetical protein MINTM021_11200 [Mycobacterium paraintracellulare]|nr:hypothetical protein MINTM021_11200 [Mycobacterium paraintracellulare]